MNHVPDPIVIKQRNSSFELLRIISMLLIILFHFSVSHSTFIQQDSFSTNKVLAYFVGSWGMTGVNCFFFISAWFLQRKEKCFDISKINTIIFEILFYAVLVLFCIKFFKLSIIDKSVIKESFIFWYINAYCFMYLMSPFLNKFINLCDKRILKKAVLLLTILLPLQNFIYPIIPMSDIELVVYDYLLIGYLKIEDNNFFERNRYKGLLITFLVIILMEVIIISFLGNTNLINRFIGRYSIAQIIISIFIFYIFKNLSFYSKFINYLTKSTLAIYILHEGSLSSLLRIQLFKLDIIYKEEYYILYLIGTAILVYISVSIIDILRRFVYKNLSISSIKSFSSLKIKINSWYNS